MPKIGLMQRSERQTLIFLGIVGVTLIAPTPTRADGDAIAIVQGVPIDRARFQEALLNSYGTQVLQQLVALELAKAETKRLGITVSRQDIDAEFRGALDRIAPGKDQEAAGLSTPEKRKVLEGMLAEKGLTMTEFMIGMERNAHLRKILERQIKIEEVDLREEFARTNGERVVVRHIELVDLDAVQTAVSRLDEGAAFDQVARDLSQNLATAPEGGLLEPFAFDTGTVPAALRETAFTLKVGERSNAIPIGDRYQILKLEQRIPPENVRFEDVRTEVERRARERIMQQGMDPLLKSLYQKAQQQGQIRVIDPKLREKYEELLKQSRETGK